MKLSLAWIFDHIDADWRTINVADLVAQFNQKTAEIEHYYPVLLDPKDFVRDFTIVSIKERSESLIVGYSLELKKDIELPFRPDAQKDLLFLVKRGLEVWYWATAADFHGDKEYLMPAISCSQQEQYGAWKRNIEMDDWIIDVDNKSINHRPDLWGHRGIAREIAALLHLPFKPLDPMLASIEQLEHEKKAPSTEHNPISITIENPTLCKRFAAAYIPHIQIQQSLLWMALRLVRIGSKPIDAFVDMTNYVMFDMSQPLHAFDAQAITSKSIVVRLAKDKEKIQLLDGQETTLTDQDLVIGDGKKPLAVAGIMGGISSAVTAFTKSIFLEAACFDAATIRKTATRIKKRTEASARFEKSLDPNQNTQAIARFLHIALENNLIVHPVSSLISLGKPVVDLVIEITHTYIEQRLGITLATKSIIALLTQLGFRVEDTKGVYRIFVPSYRSTKDIQMKDDIVEEIGRLYGYSEIPAQLPQKIIKPFSLDRVMQLRTIKKIMAYGVSLQELYHYAFFDEEFLKELRWQPERTLHVQSPVSQNWQRLVTTLIPGLLQVVSKNSSEQNNIRFFEWARIWQVNQKQESVEKNSLAGCMFSKQNFDFYQGKAELQQLFTALQMNITWEKNIHPDYPWFDPLQTADILHEGKKIGTVGMAHSSFLSPIVPSHTGFIFEFDGDVLVDYKKPVKKFIPLSKYPASGRDISFMIPLQFTVQELTEIIYSADKRIVCVELIDLFQKDDWFDEKSVTFHFVMNDENKTLSTQEVDEICKSVAANLMQHGAKIR